ncbi:competence type IV pilus assembly protein ComGB [Paucisalibacillus sp. EB02]|uniref:competence type IV pilus assembly protein ComGB n=1 Tax=Paucisalibacillus sp. EB02 TaxID=1347087 RepID=UPI0004B48496|nr:competence type IV pilus assembly protein ComGB [Paucisalibacillus sp. EB02]
MVLYQKLRMNVTKQKIKPSMQLNLLKRLSRSLENGYTLLTALETLTWDRNLEEISNKIIHLLKSGQTLDQALDELAFHPIITTYLYFAKEFGDLETSIIKCVELYERRLEYAKKFTQIIRYPFVLVAIFSFVFFFIQHSVLPNLLTLFQQNDSNGIPIAITIISLAYYGFILLLIACVLVRLLWKYVKVRIPIDLQIKLLSVIPIYRSYLRLNTSFQFSTHFGSLLKTGLSIKDVLAILSKQQKLPIVAHYATTLMSGLNQGHHVSILMKQFTFINTQLASIFQKNSNTESLEKDLSTYSTIITDELNQKIMKAITYIQPIFFILLGIIIILIYLSLLLPIYEIIQTL